MLPALSRCAENSDPVRPYVAPTQLLLDVVLTGERRWTCDAGRMVAFSARVRQWRDDRPGGLAVVDVPAALVADLGGRRQMRVTGNLNGAPFTGSTMLVAGGGLCVGVSKAAR